MDDWVNGVLGGIGIVLSGIDRIINENKGIVLDVSTVVTLPSLWKHPEVKQL